MTKEKILSLTQYKLKLLDMINSSVPSKHLKHPTSYKQFLTRELETINKKLELAKLQDTK